MKQLFYFGLFFFGLNLVASDCSDPHVRVDMMERRIHRMCNPCNCCLNACGCSSKCCASALTCFWATCCCIDLYNNNEHEYLPPSKKNNEMER